ncbi:MAG: hypothetical protein IPL79_02425 [Myxococcales bacterium]|nr:hypothetical protein [Myxococcales bacterium]
MRAAARPEFCASIAAGNLKQASHALKRDVKPTDNDHDAIEAVLVATQAQTCVVHTRAERGVIRTEPGIKEIYFEIDAEGQRRACHVDLTLASPYRFSIHPIRWNSTNPDTRCSLLEAATP